MAFDVSRVRRSLRKLETLLRKTSRRLRPEQVHDLRTRTRRCEAVVGALALDRRNERRLLSGLAKVRKRAGKVRDMDVLTGHAATVAVAGEQECLVQLLEHLGAERHRQAGRLGRVVRDRGRTLRRRLRRTAKRIERRVTDETPGPTEAAASALALSSALATPAVLTRKTLHAYRLKVKELRNVLKTSTEADGNPFVSRLREVKDAIGAWHDWEVLAAIAAEVLDHGPRCALVHELRTIGDREYERALTLTNRMRREYVRAEGRGGRKPASRVLEATASIVS